MYFRILIICILMNLLISIKTYSQDMNYAFAVDGIVMDEMTSLIRHLEGHVAEYFDGNMKQFDWGNVFYVLRVEHETGGNTVTQVHFRNGRVLVTYIPATSSVIATIDLDFGSHYYVRIRAADGSYIIEEERRESWVQVPLVLP